MRWKLFGLVCCLLWMLTPAGTAAALGGQATEQQVLDALNVNQIDADYVVLIDTSSSMQTGNLYRDAQTALRPLLASLSPKDHLSLITFDTIPTLRYDGSVGRSGAASLNELPPSATGQNTDIGAAINEGLNQLERPGANQVGTIILLTDGQHDPGPNSAYPTTSGPAWTALTDRARALSAQHALNAFALALRPTTDARLLQNVFSQSTVVDLPASQIASYLNDLRNKEGELKARALLSADTPTVSVSWNRPVGNVGDQSGDDVTVTLHSNAKFVPLVVTGAQIREKNAAFDLTGLPATVTLRPEQTRTLSVHVAFGQSGGFGFGKRTTVHHGTATLVGQVSSPWSRVMSDELNLPVRFQLASSAVPVTFASTTGWSYLTFVLLLIGTVLVAAAALGYLRSRQPRLRGAIVVMEKSELVGEYPLRGRKMTFGKGVLRSVSNLVQGTLRGVRRREPTEPGPECGVLVRISSPTKMTHTLWPGDEISVSDEVHVIYNQ